VFKAFNYGYHLGVFSYVDVMTPKERFLELLKITPEPPCVCLFVCLLLKYVNLPQLSTNVILVLPVRIICSKVFNHLKVNKH
jgi:hypothetical protein